MSVHVHARGPARIPARQHISVHTGRPTGRIHQPRPHGRPSVLGHQHISRHTGRPTGRVHVGHHHHHHHRFHYHTHATPATISGSAAAITLGILSVITGIALVALGAVSFNPVLLGVGGALIGLGVLTTGAGATCLALKLKNKKQNNSTQI